MTEAELAAKWNDVAARFQAAMRRNRMDRRMTFKEMSERTGMKPQSLHRMETEAGYIPKLTTAHLIASLFNSDLTAFINAGVDTQG